MSNNKVPTGPGWWYRKADQLKYRILFVYAVEGENFYCYNIDGSHIRHVDDGKWRGTVPMPGEWVPLELAGRMSDLHLATEDEAERIWDEFESYEAKP